MQALTNLDILYLLFGTTTTLLAYSVDRKFAEQTKKNNEMVDKIKKWRQQSKKLQYFDKLKKISNTNNTEHKDQKLNVVIQSITPTIKYNTMVIRKRELPLHVQKKWVYENVSGGNFNFTYKGKQIFTDIIDTTVLSSILSTNSKDVSIFGQMRPVVKKVQYFLRNGQRMAIVGVLSYDIATKKFKLQPMVMGISINQIIDYYQLESIYPWALRIFTFAGMALGLWFAYTPLKKIFKRIFNNLPYFRNKFKPRQQQQKTNNLQYFKNRVQIKTSQQNTFVCVLCKKNTTEIIYKCGHLSVCEVCHEKNKEINQGNVICPTCYKVSNKDIKIYFG